MTAPVFAATVQDGQIRIRERGRFDAYVRTLDGPIDVVVRKHKAQRSHPQNAYYWGVIVALVGEACGYSPDEAHDALKHHLLYENVGLLGKIKSTRSLSTAEFADYCERCRRFAAQTLGLSIPEPNEIEVAA